MQRAHAPMASSLRNWMGRCQVLHTPDGSLSLLLNSRVLERGNCVSVYILSVPVLITWQTGQARHVCVTESTVQGWTTEMKMVLASAAHVLKVGTIQRLARPLWKDDT